MTVNAVASWRPAGLLALAAIAVVGLTAAYVPGEPTPRPNLLINPTAEIDQANEGGAVASSAGALNAYVVDGFKIWLNSTATTKAAVSCQRAADAPTGYTYSLKCTVTTAASSVGSGDYLVVAIPIEADNIQDALLGTAGVQTLCRQWQVKSSIGSYTYGWSFQNFAQTRSVPNAETIGSATAWTPFASCFAGDAGGIWVTSGNAGGAYLIVTIAAGSTYQGTGGAWAGADYYGTSGLTNSILTSAGATFEITNLKLEIGPTVSPFQRLSFQQELARAQRYYQKSYDLGAAVASTTGNGMVTIAPNASGTLAASVALSAPERTIPSVVFYDEGGNVGKNSYFGSGYNNNSSNIAFVSASAKVLFFTSNTNNPMLIHYTADARL